MGTIRGPTSLTKIDSSQHIKGGPDAQFALSHAIEQIGSDVQAFVEQQLAKLAADDPHGRLVSHFRLDVSVRLHATPVAHVHDRVAKIVEEIEDAGWLEPRRTGRIVLGILFEAAMRHQRFVNADELARLAGIERSTLAGKLTAIRTMSLRHDFPPDLHFSVLTGEGGYRVILEGERFQD